MNLQVISSPHGEIRWVSGPLPGAVHDLTAARIWGIIRQLAAAGLIVLADKAYIGAGEHVYTPYPGAEQARLPESRQLRPREAAPRASALTPGSRAGASCASSAAVPWRAGQIAKAIHVLQAREIAG